ncbi:zinc ABC transporter ATP-binding protein AztA [Nocardia mangyaensis]|uniref:zinc ABC transporter ATP-binding protein AztA n=1 Tax=Nocardia mangyaensis TaxID=2213200 RepID=UPI00267618C0|nr:zinc ABC transporter ATP-binding protein AztA [Nocardia mangyaensis]MDO3648636.1 zinc ABC transporter ATP-binding protein AztA [Nocardia mangyaensis]
MRHTADSAIRIEHLTAGYARQPVLCDVTATIPRGQVTAVVGPNGSGKSTLLGVLAGTVAAQQGAVHHDTTRRPAFVVQHTAVPPTLPITVRDTVAMGRWAHRGPWRRLTREDRAITQSCLERMNLGDLATRRLDTLSGGQRQRTLLAQALAQQSDLLLLDEPAAGLDADSQAEIAQVLTEISATGVTAVQATHDLAEAQRADHCLVLRAGRLVSAGGPAEVLAVMAQ